MIKSNFPPNIDISGGGSPVMSRLEKLPSIPLSSHVTGKLVNNVCLVDSITLSVRKISCLGGLPSILSIILFYCFKKHPGFVLLRYGKLTDMETPAFNRRVYYL